MIAYLLVFDLGLLVGTVLYAFCLAVADSRREDAWRRLR